MKYGEDQKAYEFFEDMDGDGTNEKVKLVNHYHFYDKKNALDVAYTSNYIKILLDDKKVYSEEITSLGALLNPQIVDLHEKNIKKKQIYFHNEGGGPAPPMDYFFSFKDDKVIFERKHPGK